MVCAISTVKNAIAKGDDPAIMCPTVDRITAHSILVEELSVVKAPDILIWLEHVLDSGVRNAERGCPEAKTDPRDSLGRGHQAQGR